MDEISVFDYATPVHKVLMEPNQLMGIGVVPAMMILVLTIILMNLVSIWCCLIGIGLYVVAKILCKNDPYTLSILFERLLVPDMWRAD